MESNSLISSLKASHSEKIKELAKAVLITEAASIEQLTSRVDDQFVCACNYMLECQGRVVVIGMGKSGHIGAKIAATLASTGTPAFFVHPGEASHGDLGMITDKDVVLALSNSGETGEILTILPIIKRLGVALVAMTGKPQSTLAIESTVHLDISVEQEACPLGLAPTSSTTATLAMGDAIAVALLESKDFTADDFARSHPAGALGRRLLLHISDIMHTGEGIPKVAEGVTIREALMEMSAKSLGMTAVVDADDKVAGIFTDGDLRRVLDKKVDIHSTLITEVIADGCITTPANQLAAETLKIMEQRAINSLLVVDDKQRLIGALNMHDMLRSGVV